MFVAFDQIIFFNKTTPPPPSITQACKVEESPFWYQNVCIYNGENLLSFRRGVNRDWN